MKNQMQCFSSNTMTMKPKTMKFDVYIFHSSNCDDPVICKVCILKTTFHTHEPKDVNPNIYEQKLR